MPVCENATLLAEAARGAGHTVTFAAIDSLRSEGGDILAKTHPWEKVAWQSLATFDCVWILSLGTRATFLDKMQLLYALPVRVVNSPESLVFFHSKITIPALGVMEHPYTHISSDAAFLWEQFHASGESWILKSAADSFGYGIFMLKQGDANVQALLERLTEGGRRCLMQRYVKQVEQGEIRVLLAGGEVIGQYRRKATRDHRGNLHQGGVAEPYDLTDAEHAACTRVAAYLLSKGIVFSGLDIAWPYLLEWNVVSPGGIGTIARLGGRNLAETVLNKVLSPSQTVKPSL